jgi:hypothetical protein
VLLVNWRFSCGIRVWRINGSVGEPRVGNFRQKNNSVEDGIDGANGYFRVRLNYGCSAEQKFSEFRSEPFRGRENNSKFRSVELK